MVTLASLKVCGTGKAGTVARRSFRIGSIGKIIRVAYIHQPHRNPDTYRSSHRQLQITRSPLRHYHLQRVISQTGNNALKQDENGLSVNLAFSSHHVHFSLLDLGPSFNRESKCLRVCLTYSDPSSSSSAPHPCSSRTPSCHPEL